MDSKIQKFKDLRFKFEAWIQVVRAFFVLPYFSYNHGPVGNREKYDAIHPGPEFLISWDLENLLPFENYNKISFAARCVDHLCGGRKRATFFEAGPPGVIPGEQHYV
jgi:hypothetical protein